VLTRLSGFKMSEDLRFYLNVPGVRPLTFEDVTAVRDWVDAEQRLWEPFFGKGGSFGRTGISRASQYFARVDEVARLATNSPSPQTRHELRVAIDRLKDNGPGFLSDDVRWQYCRGIFDSNPRLATSLLCAFMADNWTDSDLRHGISKEYWETAVSLVLFEKGIDPQFADAFRATLKGVVTEWSQWAKLTEDDYEKLKEKLGERQSEFDAQSANLLDLKRAALSSFRELHAKHLDEAKEALNTLHKVYNQHMALQAPVEYWTKRANAMFWRIVVSGGVLTVGFIVLACVIYANFPSLKAAEPKPEHRLWEMALLLGIVGILAWPLRIVARIFMSSMHLEADALEKRTMVLSYLAMLKEDAVTEKQRDIVLASVFRPSATGMVTDDGLQVGFLETVAKSVSGK
jgi:hypothetical protein